MPSFFEESTYKKLRQRLESIPKGRQPNWGKMNTGQMFKHCQYPIQIAMEKEKFSINSNWLIKFLFKKMMYSDKPYMKNAPTLSRFKIVKYHDHESEKEKLDQWMQELWYDRHNQNRRKHPVFGNFTKDQWGIIQYKHLDHHFRQFGA